MLLQVISYLVQKDADDGRVQRLLNTTDIFILPSANPDGFAQAEIKHSAVSINEMESISNHISIGRMILSLCYIIRL